MAAPVNRTAGVFPDGGLRARGHHRGIHPAIIESTMTRAIALSKRGPAWGQNPQVGCVILGPDGRTLAEGWHRGAGTPHAEVDALSNLARPTDAVGAIAVVTLEPCNHTGRTGPCSEALLQAGIAEVHFGVGDPGRDSGGGAARLAEEGVFVERGVLADSVEQSIRPWLTAMRTGRPYITAKWASTLDGRAAAADGSSQWITGPDARADVHQRRSQSDAIVVGTGTALADDPSLTARDRSGALLPHQPAPVIIGSRTLAPDAAVFAHPETPLVFATHDLTAVFSQLFSRGIRTAFVDGGPTLTSALLAAGLVDEVLIYLAPKLLGGPKLSIGDLGVASIDEALQLELVSVDILGGDVRIIARPLPPDAERREATRLETHHEPTTHPQETHVHRNH